MIAIFESLRVAFREVGDLRKRLDESREDLEKEFENYRSLLKSLENGAYYIIDFPGILGKEESLEVSKKLLETVHELEYFPGEDDRISQIIKNHLRLSRRKTMSLSEMKEMISATDSLTERLRGFLDGLK